VCIFPLREVVAMIKSCQWMAVIPVESMYCLTFCLEMCLQRVARHDAARLALLQRRQRWLC
jgi:hypothetical protein